MADECNRVQGQAPSPEEEKLHVDLIPAPNVKELHSWTKFDVFAPCKETEVNKKVAQTRWVLPWEMVGGCGNVTERLAAKGNQDPDLEEGIADATGCVSLRSSHLRVISLSAIKKWKVWSLDIKNASIQAGGPTRNVFPQAPPERKPSKDGRT